MDTDDGACARAMQRTPPLMTAPAHLGHSSYSYTTFFRIFAFSHEASATREFPGQTFEHLKIQTFEQKHVSATIESSENRGCNLVQSLRDLFPFI